ncbi:MATE family efflux transporter [Nocardia sp. CDC153]|uniref:MATE family efflux transporter n=1 Tax=Nocardia sp. CDC153 TaxID=3112167 RepID=UPI002DBCE5F7|nr:MATE family efflux transporter [Nocardia sp. CDC153]MEC3954279.1 MATE family efflux transporter [Nocardia sp. CDC153]
MSSTEVFGDAGEDPGSIDAGQGVGESQGSRVARGAEAAAAGPGRILGIAIPTLGVLVAEPIYLLFDMAVVGRLGALALAGLAVGGLILAQVSSQLTFLSYGTTARASRRHGAGDERGAVIEGVQASWIAVGVGLAIVLVVQVFAGPITRAIAGGDDIARAAESWVRIALFGVPLILLSMAGNGWMRGVQQTRRPLMYVLAGLVVSGILCPTLVHGLLGAPRLALEGSAVANLVGQAISGGLFVSALWRAKVPLAPHLEIMKAQLVLGRDLIVRSLAFQASFVSAAAVASRFGAASVAAHQLVLQIWNFLALTLDSLAIAAQTLVGAALGAGNARGAQGLARRITAWSTTFSLALAAIFAAGYAVIPQLFTTDPSVLDRTHVVWWYFVAMIPVAGVVFALDGVLLGAGDAAFLRNATLGSALIGFLPLIWLSLAYDWGIGGIWTGLVAFMLLRLIAVGWRALSGRWARVGAEIPGRTA